MLAIMEFPAILIGLVLARPIQACHGRGQRAQGVAENLVREAFTNDSIVLLFGGILIGVVEQAAGG